MGENLNKELYANKLFDIWSQKQGLLAEEKYLITKYLQNKEGRVVEAGTGGGRIIFEIEQLGFQHLEAFDYVEKMIAFCNVEKEARMSGVTFKVADATELSNYPTDTFEYLIYLQQVLCFIAPELLDHALKEAYRIGNNNGIYLFSFLHWDSKSYNPVLSLIVNIFRKIRNEKWSTYELPWLIIDGKFNWNLLGIRQPRNFWFKREVVVEALEKHGFEILEIKTEGEINGARNPRRGHLYVACKKACTDKKIHQQ